MRFSDKQVYAARLGERDFRTSVGVGPFQCGKSESYVAGHFQWAARQFSGHSLFLMAKGQPQMDAVVLPKVRGYLDRIGVEHKMVDKGKGFAVRDYHGGWNTWRLLLAGEGKEAVLARLRGYTLSGGYIDEVDKLTKDVFDELEGRFFAVPEARVAATMNPTDPNHWVKIDLLDKLGDDGEWVQFALTDNPMIDPELVKQRAASMTPAMYKRGVLGEFAADTGMIYPICDIVSADPEPIHRLEVGVDYARYGVTAAVLVAFHAGGWTVIDEFYHDASVNGEVEDAVKARAMFDKFSAWGSVAAWAVPTDGGGIADWLTHNVQGAVYRAKDKVIPGIGILRNRFEGTRGNRLKVHERCRVLLSERAAYMWSKLMSDKGESVPDKQSANGAHLLDAARYQAATNHVAVTGMEL